MRSFRQARHSSPFLPVVVALLLVGTEILGLHSVAAHAASASGAWAVTGSMNTPRTYPTATLLPNGKVLIAGGYGIDNQTVLASAELYDPSTGTWTATGSMSTPRVRATATLLPNGKVLVAGGNILSSLTGSAELYDPATGTWTATGSMNTPRAFHTATLLPDGKVLVVGGLDNNNTGLASAELYDPATGTWTATNPMPNGRWEHTATLLPNGKVLVTGGCCATTPPNSGTTLASAELYDPSSGTWSTTGSMLTPRTNHTATLLANGRVLVVGGQSNDNLNLASAEVYDPATGVWTATGNMVTGREGHTATLLPDGTVLVAGGCLGSCLPLADAELYDPVTGTWTATAPMQFGRVGHTATLLSSGEVLVAGAAYDNGLLTTNSAELYQPSNQQCDAAAPIPVTLPEVDAPSNILFNMLKRYTVSYLPLPLQFAVSPTAQDASCSFSATGTLKVQIVVQVKIGSGPSSFTVPVPLQVDSVATATLDFMRTPTTFPSCDWTHLQIDWTPPYITPTGPTGKCLLGGTSGSTLVRWHTSGFSERFGGHQFYNSGPLTFYAYVDGSDTYAQAVQAVEPFIHTTLIDHLGMINTLYFIQEPPVDLNVQDAGGHVTGVTTPGGPATQDIPYSQYETDNNGYSAVILFAPSITPYTVTAVGAPGSPYSLSMAQVIPSVDGVNQATAQQLSGTLGPSGAVSVTCFEAQGRCSSNTPQSISFDLSTLPQKTYGDGPFDVSSYASATSGLPVSFTASGSCTNSESVITITAAGPCTIAAAQAGNDAYVATSSVTQTITIAKAPLSITASSPMIALGQAIPSITPIYNGLVNGDDAPSTPPTCRTIATRSSGAGTYSTTCSGAADTNYTISYTAGTLTIGGGCITDCGGGTATPELGSGELLITGLLPIGAALLYRRRARRRVQPKPDQPAA